VINISVGRCS